MTEQDREEFIMYLKVCTDDQVRGVYEKECLAGRNDYAQLALQEMSVRGIWR